MLRVTESAKKQEIFFWGGVACVCGWVGWVQVQLAGYLTNQMSMSTVWLPNLKLNLSLSPLYADALLGREKKRRVGTGDLSVFLSISPSFYLSSNPTHCQPNLFSLITLFFPTIYKN